MHSGPFWVDQKNLFFFDFLTFLDQVGPPRYTRKTFPEALSAAPGARGIPYGGQNRRGISSHAHFEYIRPPQTHV